MSVSLGPRCEYQQTYTFNFSQMINFSALTIMITREVIEVTWNQYFGQDLA